MDQRTLGKISKKISLLGMGGMRLPVLEDNSGKIDYPQAFEMVDHALTSGVNYFDTAWGYHDGQSEKFFGEALSARHPRDSFYLATKMPPWCLKSEEDVSRIFEQQLSNCKVDYFDFYLCHNMTTTNLETFERFHVYEYLREQQKKGRIGHLGFSFHDSPAVMGQVLEDKDWDFAQIQLNYLDWDQQQAGRLYDLLRERDIPVIIMEPVRGGSLVSLCPESTRILKEANPGASTASWAIRYAASLPGILTVLSGMSNMEQLKDNLATLSPLHPMEEGEYKVLEQAVAAYRRITTIPCTACHYCMDCPAGVNIPQLFDLYNQYQLDQNASEFAMQYSFVPSSAQASNCIACGQCVEQCPQKIDIPHWMEQIQKAYEAIPSQE